MLQEHSGIDLFRKSGFSIRDRLIQKRFSITIPIAMKFSKSKVDEKTFIKVCWNFLITVRLQEVKEIRKGLI